MSPEDRAPLPVDILIPPPRDEEATPEDNSTSPDAPEVVGPVSTCIKPEVENPSPERNDVSPLEANGAAPLETVTRPPRPDNESPAMI